MGFAEDSLLGSAVGAEGLSGAHFRAAPFVAISAGSWR